MPALTMGEPGVGQEFPAKLTSQVIVCSVIAAFGGFMFGYDLSVSGGVTSMDGFLNKFFPTVYNKKHQARADNYCKYNNQFLQLFTSSLYLAAIVASFVASIVCKKRGRKPAMQIASVFFLLGAFLDATAQNLGILIAGRLCLGIGIGFGNQAVPLFISEIAPAKYRGGLNICFQLLLTLGGLITYIINYFTSKLHPYGWRISLGGAAVPAIVLLIGSFAIVETPTSLIERGKREKGFYTLKLIRGVDNVDEEYAEILSAVKLAKQVKYPFKNLMSQSNRLPLICGTFLLVFQEFTGINVVTFYAPVIFQTMGFGDDASLLSSIIPNTLKPICNVIAILFVDKVGRKVLLVEGTIQMLISQCSIGGIFAVHLKSTSTMERLYATCVIFLICLFLSGFAWLWGPLGWLIPSEIYPIEIRSAGFSIAVSLNLFCIFLIAQSFLTMLCHMRSGIFFFFAAWLAAMGLFAIFMLPETKGIPIDEMIEKAWKKHWFWRRYYKDNYTVKEEHEIQEKAQDEPIQ